MRGQKTVYGSRLHFLNLILWLHYLQALWCYCDFFFVTNDVNLICLKDFKYAGFVTDAAKCNLTVCPKSFIVDINAQFSYAKMGINWHRFGILHVFLTCLSSGHC